MRLFAFGGNPAELDMQPKMATVGYVANVLMTLMVSLIGKLNIQNKTMEQEASERSGAFALSFQFILINTSLFKNSKESTFFQIFATVQGNNGGFVCCGIVINLV